MPARLHTARLARLLLVAFVLAFPLAAPFEAADPVSEALHLAGDNYSNGGG